MAFREDFVWGAATAAYQIEGGHDADGRRPSVWDQLCDWPGKVFQGHTGKTGPDHYHRLEEDLDLMAQMGLKAYRFSVCWPRVIPEGTGAVNEKGLDFYDRLIDGLLARGIQPWLTLFHWDYPLALYHRGGWLNADAPAWFAEYAGVLARRFGDRVQHWMTLNEPQIFIGLGHQMGIHAPGLQYPAPDVARMSHLVLLSHGKAVQALRGYCERPATIGWAPAINPTSVDPAYVDDVNVVAAANDSLFDCTTEGNYALQASLWCDPVFLGRYPSPFVDAFADALPKGWENDLGTIASPIDFCGMNIYSAWRFATRNTSGDIVTIEQEQFGEGYPRTLFDWPVTPSALYWGPKFFHERYRVPIVITENGLSSHDWIALDGQVHDPQRIDFVTRYLRELKCAAAGGTDIRGYFLWSLMDNFEWAEGYRHRFGLIHVDYLNGQKRTIKDSGHWYRDVIANNGATL